MALRTFQDGVAVLTGGASGIGAALARELARRGALVVLADRQIELARETAASVLTGGGKAEAAALDVRDAVAVESLIADVWRRHGRLDYLFNNAGIGVGGEARDYKLDDWRDVIEINLIGVANGVHAAYPRMVEQGFGHIVNTASMSGLMPSPFTVSYGAAKHGVVGLSRSLRAEASHYGVRVSVLCPGVIRTPILVGPGRFGRMTKPIDEQTQRIMMERFRPMDPDVFAAKALSRVAANQEIVVVPAWWKAIWWLNRLSPALGTALAARGFEQMKKTAEAGTGSQARP